MAEPLGLGMGTLDAMAERSPVIAEPDPEPEPEPEPFALPQKSLAESLSPSRFSACTERTSLMISERPSVLTFDAAAADFADKPAPPRPPRRKPARGPRPTPKGAAPQGAAPQGATPRKKMPWDATTLFTSGVSLINLKRRTDRLEAFLEDAPKALGDGVAVDVVEAFDGFQLHRGGSFLSGMFEPLWDASNLAEREPSVEPGCRFASFGEQGCALSHASIWRRIAPRGTKDSWHLVCEDDVKLHPRFAFQIARLWPRLWHARCDVVYLGFHDYGQRRYAEGTGNCCFRPEYTLGMHCYALRNTAAAKLAGHLPVVGPVDAWLADNQWFGLDVFCLVVPGEGVGGAGGKLASHRTQGRVARGDVDHSSDDPPIAVGRTEEQREALLEQKRREHRFSYHPYAMEDLSELFALDEELDAAEAAARAEAEGAAAGFMESAEAPLSNVVMTVEITAAGKKELRFSAAAGGVPDSWDGAAPPADAPAPDPRPSPTPSPSPGPSRPPSSRPRTATPPVGEAATRPPSSETPTAAEAPKARRMEDVLASLNPMANLLGAKMNPAAAPPDKPAPAKRPPSLLHAVAPVRKPKVSGHRMEDYVNARTLEAAAPAPAADDGAPSTAPSSRPGSRPGSRGGAPETRPPRPGKASARRAPEEPAHRDSVHAAIPNLHRGTFSEADHLGRAGMGTLTRGLRRMIETTPVAPGSNRPSPSESRAGSRAQTPNSRKQSPAASRATTPVRGAPRPGSRPNSNQMKARGNASEKRPAAPGSPRGPSSRGAAPSPRGPSSRGAAPSPRAAATGRGAFGSPGATSRGTSPGGTPRGTSPAGTVRTPPGAYGSARTPPGSGGRMGQRSSTPKTVSNNVGRFAVGATIRVASGGQSRPVGATTRV